MNAIGNLELNLTPTDFHAEGEEDIALGRILLTKSYFGDLTGNSKGEMLSAMTRNHASGGYVGIEQFVGNLNKRQGSFVLQHCGVMDNQNEQLILEVLPDSGRGQLEGIRGNMVIQIRPNENQYSFEYQLD